jgi:signal transduction histidine kinase
LVERVLQNLIENGIRHAPAGATVTVGIRAHGAYLAFFVRNPLAAAQHSPNNAKAYSPGLGFGLAITVIIELPPAPQSLSASGVAPRDPHDPRPLG